MKRLPQERRPGAPLADWILPLAIALLSILAFAPVLQGDFVAWDDDRNFVTNFDYRGLGLTQLRWMWTTFHLGHYIPLSWMSLGLDYTIWGMDARGYHLTNLLLHAFVAVMVYLLARRLIAAAVELRADEPETPWIQVAAAIGALLFAVHPLRAESVAWITERRDVLSGSFALLSLYCYLRGAEEGRRAVRWYWGAVGLFLCGILSKGTVVTLPALILVLNVYPLRRIGWANGWFRPENLRVYAGLIPFGIISLFASAMSLVALPDVPQLPTAGKIAVSLYSLAFYTWKTFAPTDLAPLYTLPRVVDPLETRFILSGVFVLVISGAALALRRRWPAFLTAWIAFVLALFPMLGFHQNGPQIVADRYTYHATPVLAILAAAALALLFRTRFRQLALGASLAALVALFALTWKQSRIWVSSEALWAQVIRVDTRGWIGENNWGNILMGKGELVEAERHFRLAIERNPGYAEAFNNLGVALVRQGRANEAVEPFSRALAVLSSYDEAEVNLGGAFSQLGEHERAIERYRRALQINTRNTAALINWANALLRLERPLEAIPLYESALAIEPGNSVARTNLGVAHAMAEAFSAKP